MHVNMLTWSDVPGGSPNRNTILQHGGFFWDLFQRNLMTDGNILCDSDC